MKTSLSGIESYFFLSFDKIVEFVLNDRDEVFHQMPDRDIKESFNFAFKISPFSFVNYLDKEQTFYADEKISEYKLNFLSVIHKLKRDPLSRQAILRFGISTEYPNCMLDIQFQIRDERVIATVYQRSLDILAKVQQDIEIVSRLVFKLCLEMKLSYEKSYIEFLVGNAHYFEIDKKLAYLNTHLRNCEACDLCLKKENAFNYDKGYGKLQGLKSNNAKKIDFLFVGYSPSLKREEKLYKAFDVTNNNINSGFLRILEQLKISDRSYITNAIKCSIDNKNGIDNEKEAADECSFLLDEISILNPKVIVVLGDITYNVLSPIIKEMDNVVKVYHPSYCFAYRKMSYIVYRSHIKSEIEKFL